MLLPRQRRFLPLAEIMQLVLPAKEDEAQVPDLMDTQAGLPVFTLSPNSGILKMQIGGGLRRPRLAEVGLRGQSRLIRRRANKSAGRRGTYVMRRPIHSPHLSYIRRTTHSAKLLAVFLEHLVRTLTFPFSLLWGVKEPAKVFLLHYLHLSSYSRRFLDNFPSKCIYCDSLLWLCAGEGGTK